MTWSVSISGPKERVKRELEDAFRKQPMTFDDLRSMQALVDCLPGTHVTVTAGGHQCPDGLGGSFNANVTSHTQF